jgi:hypothetical protein
VHTRIRTWLEDDAHVFTIASALVVLGVVGGVALVFQALLGALVALSPIERVLLGICAFLVVLGIILAGLK